MDLKKRVGEISKKVGETVSSTYNTVTDKSEKFIENTKLESEINGKTTEIELIYEEIGKVIYERYKAGEDVGDDFTKQAKKIDKLNKEIDEMNTKVLYNKSLRVCASCGEVIALDSKFCTNCGEKQKAVKIKTEKKEAKAEKETTVVCPECGEVCASTSKFCSKCGHKF